MAIEVFNRYEDKFLLNTREYILIQKEIKKYMEIDEYNKEDEFYTISNIYYDTEDDYLIRTSLEKPKYKEKIRLRAYGVPEKNGKAYLEIKKKVNGLVNKRRSTLMLNEAYRFLKTGKMPEIKSYMNKQVLNELQYAIKLYNVVPKLYLAYDRKAFFGKENSNLRLTIDTNIRTRRYDLKLEKGDYGENLLPLGQWLMEVKTDGGIPVWLSKFLSENNIYKTSFSKYGTEYNKMLQAKLGITREEEKKYA